jgi:hypothetical protein
MPFREVLIVVQAPASVEKNGLYIAFQARIS